MKKLSRDIGRARVLGLAASVAFAFSGVSHAAGEVVAAERYELIIVQNTLGQREILAGNLEGAIEKLDSRNSLNSPYEKHTSLCAAYTAQRQFSAAEKHCRTAVNLGRASNGSMLVSRSVVKARAARALNNLGVMNALQGNSIEALEYFQSARSMSKYLNGVSERNIKVLGQRVDENQLAAF